MSSCGFLCGTLCGKNFQNLLKYDSKDKICKIEIQHFQQVTYYHEVRKLRGLAYESVGRVFESPWARQLFQGMKSKSLSRRKERGLNHQETGGVRNR